MCFWQATEKKGARVLGFGRFAVVGFGQRIVCNENGGIKTSSKAISVGFRFLEILIMIKQRSLIQPLLRSSGCNVAETEILFESPGRSKMGKLKDV